MRKCHRIAKIGKKCRIFANHMFFMGKSCIKSVLLCVVGLLFAIIVPAQDLPVLPADKAIKTGSLPNGTKYYLVSNPTIKGVADFALIQKTGIGNLTDSSANMAMSVARDALAELPRCGGSSVQEFFTSHGVNPGQDGFVRVTDNATEFHFKDVLLSKPEVLDSALLVILDMVDRVSTTDDVFVRNWYAPSDQAVIVSGDINPDSVAEKLKLMSYMTPYVKSADRIAYVWNERDSAQYVKLPVEKEGLSSITATWYSSRIPKEDMNTVQPIIYEMFMTQIGMVAEEYLQRNLRLNDIPFADISSGCRTSVQTSGDEAFSVSMYVSDEDFSDAVRVFSGVMGGIDAGSTDVRDLKKVQRVFLDSANDMAEKPFSTNAEYVDQCMTAFLYNGSLSTLQTKVDFLTGRVLADSTELRLFNNISSALLDPERNLTITYSSPMSQDSLRTIFSSSWSSNEDVVFTGTGNTVADIPFYAFDDVKVRIRSEKTDHMSKGKEWLFSNGFKVIYKQLLGLDRIHYNLALNGGFGAVEGLERGEGGYVSDYFFLSRIYGMPADEYLSLLASEGMSVDVYVGLNNMMVSGGADEDKTDLMLKALVSIMNGRVLDEEAVKYHEAGERIRNLMRMGTTAEMKVKINDIMCPDYDFVSHKMLDSIPEGLSYKAERFFRSQSAKTNDGVLIIVGDLDENLLKKQLTEYVGGFIVTDRAFKRPLVRYQPTSGWSTYTVQGDRNSVDIAMSVPIALTADNFMAAEIAAMVLKKNLSDAVIDTGMYLELSHECKIYPSERIEFHIALKEASPEGFASDVEHSGPIEALAVVRSVLSGMSGTEVTAEDVETFKNQFMSRMNHEMKEPFYWLNVISRRHLAGKDFTTGHESRIKAVNVDKVKAVLSTLKDGSRVEYIVSR